MVTTNGVPKMGNHALVKAVQLLGVPCEINHLPYVAQGVSYPHVFIKRDPRNTVMSWVRFNGKPRTQGMFITALQDFNGLPIERALALYEGWLSDPSTFVVRYEDLIASDAEMRRIAVHLGVPYLEDAFPALPGLTSTWNPNHCDYRTIWSPEVEAAWQAHDGAGILARWGY